MLITPEVAGVLASVIGVLGLVLRNTHVASIINRHNNYLYIMICRLRKTVQCTTFQTGCRFFCVLMV